MYQIFLHILQNTYRSKLIYMWFFSAIDAGIFPVYTRRGILHGSQRQNGTVYKHNQRKVRFTGLASIFIICWLYYMSPFAIPVYVWCIFAVYCITMCGCIENKMFLNRNCKHFICPSCFVFLVSSCLYSHVYCLFRWYVRCKFLRFVIRADSL